MSNPEYVKVNNKKYKIDTSFRTAIKCIDIANDFNIYDYERALAIIYMLFGDEALDDKENYEKLLKLAQKYLSCGQELKEDNDNEIDMDFTQDMNLIETSFLSDYNMDISNSNMHWWKFYDLVNGLSNSEMGNCCILNRIRNLRNTDTSKIKDFKIRQQTEEMQQRFALKKHDVYTKEEEDNINEFYSQLGIERSE